MIIVVCEGKNTEPDYIKEFSRDKRHNLVQCKTIEGVGCPQSIVDKAVAEKQNQIRTQKANKNSYDSEFEIWCISDKDEHPNLREAMQRANDNSIGYILSNPCIELWGYLYYDQHDAPIDRHAMQRKLSTVMKGYDHKSGARFNYQDMNSNGSYSDALARSKELIKRRIQEDSPNGNPSTNIYELLESITDMRKLK